MGVYLEEQGERFHHDVKYFEQRYQVQYSENVMEDYIWSLMRERRNKHKRTTKNV